MQAPLELWKKNTSSPEWMVKTSTSDASGLPAELISRKVVAMLSALKECGCKSGY